MFLQYLTAIELLYSKLHPVFRKLTIEWLFKKMRMRFIIIIVAGLFLNTCDLFAQNKLTLFVKDKETKENLQAVTANIIGSKNAVISDSTGKIFFSNLSAGEVKITFSIVGYESQIISFRVPLAGEEPLVYLQKKENKEEEVIISSSRTDSRIEDLPTKVEVLGSEEIDEESSTMPGNIASLLGDIAGIQSQRTSEATASVDLKVQGLPGKYTQLLRDGLPLFGGYSGSFSVLQIPPLDLKQVEIIKGASSTLYGGGAIAGMINLVSKTPQLKEPQHSFLINRSTLNETNLNTFHSYRSKKAGYTLFGGTTLQRAKDVNKDGFSDVPDLTSFFFHPKLFIYPNKKNVLTLEYDGTYEDRNGGDMQVLHKTSDSVHRFFIQNKSLRNSVAATWEYRINATERINLKGLYSYFNRDINNNIFGMKAFQRSFFTEFTYLKKWKNHTMVTGFNISGESFKIRQPDSSGIHPYNNTITGVFMQDDWRITKAFTVQPGLRLDHIIDYDPVLLPRLSLLYKINQQFTTRLGGGMGYKAPSVFSNDIDERELRDHNLLPGVLMERSLGANWDINYKGTINDWNLTINQMFYVTQINRPLIADNNGTVYNYINATRPLNTRGFETYIAIKYDELEMYLGYTYTIAKQLYEPLQPFVPLSAKSKFAAVISNEFSKRFRACIELSYTGRQYLDDGSKTAGYLTASPMVRYNIKNISLVLNCENILDYRQTRKEDIVTGPVNNPGFKQIWAPLDGRVVNLSARINW